MVQDLILKMQARSTENYGENKRKSWKIWKVWKALNGPQWIKQMLHVERKAHTCTYVVFYVFDVFCNLVMIVANALKDGMQREASEEAYCKTETSRSEARSFGARLQIACSQIGVRITSIDVVLVYDVCEWCNPGPFFTDSTRFGWSRWSKCLSRLFEVSSRCKTP